MKPYDFKKIEKKWQKYWESKKLFHATDPSLKHDTNKPKFYALIEFPFPSGEGMHIGHLRSNTAMDIIARKRRMQGYNVLYPIGWDAFGLPTENFAIKTGQQPKVVTKKNTDNFRRQLQSAGFSFDWSREINTTDPEYYKWTQWIFLQMYKAGLAYKKKMVINWCPKDKIGLANEEVIDGKCERCGTGVEKKEKEQWMLAITKYADRLDRDLDTVDYVEKIKVQQRNWIGKSEGAEIDFLLKNSSEKIKVFTTRPDTIFGVTYVVLAPEHTLIQDVLSHVSNKHEVETYIKAAKNKSDIDRTSDSKEKTGVELKGIKVINPANKEEIPVYVADYVLGGYGTGAIMAVPAHDERDFEFAKKYNLPIKEVIHPKEYHFQEIDVRLAYRTPFTDNGVLINSGQFTNLNTEEAKKKIIDYVGGKMVTTYKLRDWVFSRQRYWGEPIPMINCPSCGWVPVPEKDLPVKLPEVKNYQPTDNGESPLATIKKWVNTTCPSCGGKATRETDTMPNWAGSSWYYLRYIDSKNKKAFASQEKLNYWNQVDWYNGGMEHTTLHLLYSRFWHKFLFDQGLVPTSEPYKKRTAHGIILASDGEKMSKSRGNVVNPDNIIENVGADALRLYQMFMGPFDQMVSWSEDGVVGPKRFLEKVWKMHENFSPLKIRKVAEGRDDINLETSLHKTIKKVSEDIESMQFNTAVSALMIFANTLEELEKKSQIQQNVFEVFLKLLSPFAPHICEEIWANLGHKNSICREPWPIFDASKIVKREVTVAVQINGKVRAEVNVAPEINEQKIKEKVLALADVRKWTEGKKVKKFIYVKGRIVNIVVE